MHPFIYMKTSSAHSTISKINAEKHGARHINSQKNERPNLILHQTRPLTKKDRKRRYRPAAAKISFDF